MGGNPDPWVGTQTHGWEPRPMGGNPDPWVGTQTHGWEPRPVGGNPDPWVGTQTHGWEPRPMGGNPDPWVGTQARGWEPRPMGGNPDPWVGTQAHGWEPRPVGGKSLSHPSAITSSPFPTRLQIPVGHIMMTSQTGSKHCIPCATCHKKRPQVAKVTVPTKLTNGQCGRVRQAILPCSLSWVLPLGANRILPQSVQ